MAHFKLKALVTALSLCNLAVHATQEEHTTDVKISEELVVYGEIGYRNRSQELAPTLEYSQEYWPCRLQGSAYKYVRKSSDKIIKEFEKEQ